MKNQKTISFNANNFPLQNCGMIIVLMVVVMVIATANAQGNYYNPYGYPNNYYGNNGYSNTGYSGGYYNPYSYNNYGSGSGSGYGYGSQSPYYDYSYLFNLYNAYRNTGYPTQYGSTNGLTFAGK